jgi:ribosomal protein L37AE/L43A
MSDTLIALFGCTGMLLVGALVVGYLITSFSRKKSACPQCGRKSVPKKALVKDPVSGTVIPAERDFGYALVTGLGVALIGAALALFFITMIVSNLGNDSCTIKGLSQVCVSYGGGSKVTTTVNLLFAFLVIVGGLGGIVNGVQKIRRAAASRGKPMTLEFTCPSCKHTWEEEQPAPAAPVTTPK